MTMSRRAFVPLASLVPLAGCGALSSLSGASDVLDTYTLTPLPPTGKRPAGRGHIVIEAPSAGGALTTDRILIKPGPRQAQYLPDARWSDPAPAMLQTLLVVSLLNRGGLRLVGRDGAGLMPDYTLMTEILGFEAEKVGPERAEAQVHVSLQMTLIREVGRSVASARAFATTVPVTSDKTLTLVEGFDRAMQGILADAVAWVRSVI